MTSSNFSFNYVPLRLEEYSDDLLLKPFVFDAKEWSMKSDTITTMLKDYKNEMKRFFEIKKILDLKDCPALLQSVAYHNLSTSRISFTPDQLRHTAMEFIIDSHRKINKLYWTALLEKLNIERIFLTNKATKLINSMADEMPILKENFGMFYGYPIEGLNQKSSIYICADFTANNIRVLLNGLKKPLTTDEIKEELKLLKDKHNMNIIQNDQTFEISSNRTNTCSLVVSMLYMSTKKASWISHFSENHLMTIIKEDRLKDNKIPKHLSKAFSTLYADLA